MEYTKDIILSVNYEEGEKLNKNWTSSIFKLIKRNKFIISVVSVTIYLMLLDVILINNFIYLLTKI